MRTSVPEFWHYSPVSLEAANPDASLARAASRCLNGEMKRPSAPKGRTLAADVVRRLESAYGSRQLVPNCDPLSTLVETILSQNTSDANSGRAFRSLKVVFPKWEDVAAADPRRISDSIRAGGLADIKGKRIKAVLQRIQQLRGDLNLDFLNALVVAEARDWLKDLPGVGEKTAACVLLFSFGKPALPVDTHILRISKRLRLIDEEVSADEAHGILQNLVLRSLIYQFHVLMIEHGRRTCRAQHPACPTCALADVCPSSAIYYPPQD